MGFCFIIKGWFIERFTGVFGSIFYESVLIWNSFWKLDVYRAEVSKELGLSAEPNCRLIRCRFPRFSQTQPPLKPDDKYSELPTFNEFIGCFHQFVSRIISPNFLSLSSWKRKQNSYWSKTGFFSVCQLRKLTMINFHPKIS